MELSAPPKLKKGEISTGTSIMALKFKGGVIMGADSRTSSGSYVANRVTDKLTPISERIYCCRSGSAAHTQAIADIVRYYLGMNSIQLETEYPSVDSAARLFQLLCYQNKQLLAGIICAGWDPKNGGQVFSIPLGGTLVKQDFAIGGSGSTFIYGLLDNKYKQNMTKEECITLVKECLAHAMARDGSSGGVIRLLVIDKDGVERKIYTNDEIPASDAGPEHLESKPVFDDPAFNDIISSADL